VSGELAKALVAVQADIPAVEKDKRGNYGVHMSLDHLIAKTRPVLHKHGLSINQFPEVSEVGQPVLRTTVTHTSGESVSSVMPLFMQQQNMQQLGSSITYARRYAWAAALGIASEEDDDGEQTKTAGAQQTAPPAAKSTFTAPTGDTRTDAQAALLLRELTFLKDKDAMSDEAFVSAAGSLGLEATSADEVIARANKQQASELISKLTNLKKNIGRQAA
jgi:hypothetical protein